MNKYPPRPHATREIILQAAQTAADEMNEPDLVETIADAYQECGPDGFAIAKELDRNGWYIEAGDVEALGGIHDDVQRVVRQLGKAWVAENSILPPLEIGTVIDEGVIAGVHDTWPAYYLVKESGCTDKNRHKLIKFEYAKPVSSQEDAADSFGLHNPKR